MIVEKRRKFWVFEIFEKSPEKVLTFRIGCDIIREVKDKSRGKGATTIYGKKSEEFLNWSNRTG